MKLTVKIAALLLVLTTVIPIFFACRNDADGNINIEEGKNDNTVFPLSEESYLPEAEKGVVTAPAPDAKVYNVIFALATVPPVLAALDSISSGYETYAIIERGKTYNGIEKIKNFNNAGFDPTSNESNGFTYTEFNAMVEKVKELREAEENSFFYIYAQDGTALRAAAVAANAGIPLEDFHVIMCEDGSGSYKTLREYFFDGKIDPLDKFLSLLNEVGPAFNTVMSKRDNKNSDEVLKYSLPTAFALSVLPNFTYWLQDGENVAGILRESDLAAIFGVGDESVKTEFSANLRFMTIAEKMNELTDEQKADYLTLMYGDYYENTYAALTRTTRAAEAAPAEKLVFIGARHGYYPKFASDAKYGIGGIGKKGTLPESYAALDEKYKTPLLFGSEADYEIFLSVINDASNYPENAPAEVIAQMKAECFDLYIDYIYTFKFTYSLYGADYDIILKGHPREVIGASEEWNARYTVVHIEVEGDGIKETKYSYDKLLDSALCAFHANDSAGKYIGMVPYGTAAENLAYLGVDITVCGLPSSTYSGLDKGVPVLFLIAETDESICGDDSQVKDRFNAGNLTYEQSGEEVNSIFFNNGNFCKTVAEIMEKSGDDESSTEFEKLFSAWLAANRPGSADIDAQGFGK
jgi:hypothetical protein